MPWLLIGSSSRGYGSASLLLKSALASGSYLEPAQSQHGDGHSTVTARSQHGRSTVTARSQHVRIAEVVVVVLDAVVHHADHHAGPVQPLLPST